MTNSDQQIDYSGNNQHLDPPTKIEEEAKIPRVRFAEESTKTSNNGTNASTSETSTPRHIDFVREHRLGCNVYDHYEKVKLLGSVYEFIVFTLIISIFYTYLNPFFISSSG
jgi:hypothetical protein